MGALFKMFVGILILLAGLAWYAVELYPGLTILGVPPLSALKTVAVGSFGLLLALFGLLMAWVEYEDWKWEQREKEEMRKAEEEAKKKARAKKRTAKKRTKRKK